MQYNICLIFLYLFCYFCHHCVVMAVKIMNDLAQVSFSISSFVPKSIGRWAVFLPKLVNICKAFYAFSLSRLMIWQYRRIFFEKKVRKFEDPKSKVFCHSLSKKNYNIFYWWSWQSSNCLYFMRYHTVREKDI